MHDGGLIVVVFVRGRVLMGCRLEESLYVVRKGIDCFCVLCVSEIPEFTKIAHVVYVTW